MRFLFSIFLLAFTTGNAQKIVSIPSNFSFKPSPFETLDFGYSSVNVYYSAEFHENFLAENGKKNAICILQLGEFGSKFSDYNQLRLDSLDQKYKAYNVLQAKEANEYLNIPLKWENVLLKSNGVSFVQDNFRKIYQYEEATPNLTWQLEAADEKVILGHKCQKASTTYRGRKYIAWYSTDIPINKGPFVFEGLPGLIMELTDLENKYHFVAIAIDKKPMKIYLRNEKSIIKTTREKFRVVQRSYYENPNAFYAGKAISADGTPLIQNSKSIPYSPLELE